VTMVLSFVVVIGVLILIHELGHFLVARWVGVGVERFSIGFGPVLLRWRGKETEYALSLIPMGGYVKMMGEENPLEGGEATPYDPKKAFALKPLWARFLIVFAGPGMNFILAAVIVMLLAGTVGRPVWPATIGRVSEGSAAATAGLQPGDTIVAVDGQPARWWEDVERAVAASEGRPLELRVRRGAAERTVTVTPKRTQVTDPIFKEARDFWDFGAEPLLTPQVAAVNAGSSAERAGVQPGDVIVAVAGTRVNSREEVQREIQKRPGETFQLTVERGGTPLTMPVTASAERERRPDGREVAVGRIGIAITPRTERVEPYDPVNAVKHGVAWTSSMTALTVKGIWKLIVGSLDRSNIGGPIQIAAEAGRQAKEGPTSLALFTAVISVNLAVLNLLPVPMLDGGHLAFFIIEGVLGRPISLKKRELAQQVGFVLLMLLMVYALYNDLVRIDAFKFLR
jgi:regulator of sigma E protease